MGEPDRWAAFTDEELAELLIALDHRRAEAQSGDPGNVRTGVVAALIADIERHCSGRDTRDADARLMRQLQAVAEWADRYDGEIAAVIRDVLNGRDFAGEGR